MKTFVVMYVYRCPVTGLNEQGAYKCLADDAEHAVEQVLNAFPGATASVADARVIRSTQRRTR